MSKIIDIKIILNKIDYPIPYDYYQRMHGYIVSLLGDDNYGQLTNKFSYTNLIGGDNTKEGIVFKDNPYFIIRTADNDIFYKLTSNIKDHTKLFLGLTICGISWVDVDVKNKKYFSTLKQSPILVSKKYNKIDNLLPQDIIESETYLVDNLRRKANSIGFKLGDDLKIKIQYQFNHKDINYNNFINKGRVFKLKIETQDIKTKEFIMINGLGRSCGCGFGFIY